MSTRQQIQLAAQFSVMPEADYKRSVTQRMVQNPFTELRTENGADAETHAELRAVFCADDYAETRVMQDKNTT